jgi:hypothetical protein
MKPSNPQPAKPHADRRHWGRAQKDGVLDPYKRPQKLHEPTRCPQCGAVYQQGRWTWSGAAAGGAVHEELCQACHRINDHYPAGVVTLSGGAVQRHKAEMVPLARHQEEAERQEHPLNRIIDIVEEASDRIVINTTDIHLPKRIGEALKRAFQGSVEYRYDQDGYFVRVDWHRDD